ncbi:MAG: flagellin [Clostridiaceae bacterium]
MGGTAYRDIFVLVSAPSLQSSYGSQSYSYMEGRKKIEDNFIIDETNKDLQFDYWQKGTKETISITLEEGTYSTKEDLVKEINDKLMDKRVKAMIYDEAIKLICEDAGSDYKINTASGGFYDNVLSSEGSVREVKAVGGTISSHKDRETYIVGRKDISNGIVINPGINDVLTFDLRHNGIIKETISITIPAEHHSPENLIDKINEELEKQGTTNVKAEYGTVNTGTTADDRSKLVLRYFGQEDEGSYAIDGVRGNSAYSIFYNASGDPVPTYTVGTIDLSQGVTIVNGENETFTFDVDGKENTIILSQGDYTAETLLEEINNKLTEIDSKVVASYYEGRLKLGYKGLGFHTIDNIRGNARDILFMEIKGRDEVLQNYVQAGANEKDSIALDTFYMSSELLRINTTLIGNKELAQKSLVRLDSALKSISTQRGKLGAYQNKLEHILNNLGNYAENLQASESRIKDLDMAKEVMKFTKTKILEQVSQAILAQANEQSQRIIQLLLDK